MKTLLLTTAAALCLATSAFANDPHIPAAGGGDATATAISTPSATSIAGAAAGAQAGALSGSTSSAVNGPNTAITGPSTATANSTGGRSDASATLGNLNSFGGSSTLIAPVTTTDINTNGQQQGQAQRSDTSTSTSTSTNQAQTLTDSSVHTQATTATTGASTSSASGNGAGQQTSVVTNYEAQKRNPVSSAYAAPLQIGSLVCGMSKVSGALQLPGVGASGQVGTIDAGCERRSTADVFARLGLTYEACIIMVRDPVAMAAGLSVDTCQRPTVAAAYSPPAPQAEPAKEPQGVATMMPIPNPPKTPRGA